MEAVGAEIGENDGHRHRKHRHGRRKHAQPQAADDDRGRARGSAFRDFTGRFVGLRSVIFRNLPDNHAGHKARDDGEGYPVPILQPQPVKDEERRRGDEHRAELRAAPEGREELLDAGMFLGAYRIDADDGQEDAHSGYQHGGYHGFLLHRGVGREGRCAERGGGEDGPGIGFVEIGAHSGHVAHVVAHVVGNGGRVARVIFRDARLHFSHQVCAHVGRLGIDSAAHAGKKRLARSAHAEGQHRGRDEDELLSAGEVGKCLEDQVPRRNVQQREAHHGKAHDSSRAESHLKPVVKRLPRCPGRAGGGVSGRLHAHISGQGREESASQEGHRHPVVLQIEKGQHQKEHRQADKDDAHHLVLLAEVGHGAFAHGFCYFLHEERAFVPLLHRRIEVEGHGERHKGRHGSNPEQRMHHRANKIRTG